MLTNQNGVWWPYTPIAVKKVRPKSRTIAYFQMRNDKARRDELHQYYRCSKVLKTTRRSGRP